MSDNPPNIPLISNASPEFPSPETLETSDSIGSLPSSTPSDDAQFHPLDPVPAVAPHDENATASVDPQVLLLPQVNAGESVLHQPENDGLTPHGSVTHDEDDMNLRSNTPLPSHHNDTFDTVPDVTTDTHEMSPPASLVDSAPERLENDDLTHQGSVTPDNHDKDELDTPSIPSDLLFDNPVSQTNSTLSRVLNVAVDPPPVYITTDRMYQFLG